MTGLVVHIVHSAGNTPGGTWTHMKGDTIRKQNLNEIYAAGDPAAGGSQPAKKQKTEHIDHVFEVQEFHQNLAHLKKGLNPADVELVEKIWDQHNMADKVRNDINHHENLAPVDAHANNCLGQVTGGGRCIQNSHAADAALEHLNNPDIQAKRQKTAEKLSGTFTEFASHLENHPDYQQRAGGSTKFIDDLKTFGDVNHPDGLVARTKKTHEEVTKSMTETKKAREDYDKLTADQKKELVITKSKKWDSAKEEEKWNKSKTNIKMSAADQDKASLQVHFDKNVAANAYQKEQADEHVRQQKAYTDYKTNGADPLTAMSQNYEIAQTIINNPNADPASKMMAQQIVDNCAPHVKSNLRRRLYRRQGSSCTRRVSAMNNNFKAISANSIGENGEFDPKAMLKQNRQNKMSLKEVNAARVADGKKAITLPEKKAKDGAPMEKKSNQSGAKGKQGGTRGAKRAGKDKSPMRKGAKGKKAMKRGAKRSAKGKAGMRRGAKGKAGMKRGAKRAGKGKAGMRQGAKRGAAKKRAKGKKSPARRSKGKAGGKMKAAKGKKSPARRSKGKAGGKMKAAKRGPKGKKGPARRSKGKAGGKMKAAKRGAKGKKSPARRSKGKASGKMKAAKRGAKGKKSPARRSKGKAGGKMKAAKRGAKGKKGAARRPKGKAGGKMKAAKRGAKGKKSPARRSKGKAGGKMKAAKRVAKGKKSPTRRSKGKAGGKMNAPKRGAKAKKSPTGRSKGKAGGKMKAAKRGAKAKKNSAGRPKGKTGGKMKAAGRSGSAAKGKKNTSRKPTGRAGGKKSAPRKSNARGAAPKAKSPPRRSGPQTAPKRKGKGR
ncbi:hypothetical protein HDU67_007797 [Dinochytrium kinnereticum]|nr:hypothetical protein HDU67_007797 [Dinochytrium kinnereticum]